LAHAHTVLQQIADGEINPRELPESAELLTRSEPDAEPAATVVHVAQGRRPAA
jgi:WhiB family redox-sensing transcriptional regulator